MTLPRIVGVVALLALAGFCVFGFFATHQPPETTARVALRIAYAVVAVASLAGAGLLSVWRRR